MQPPQPVGDGKNDDTNKQMRDPCADIILQFRNEIQRLEDSLTATQRQLQQMITMSAGTQVAADAGAIQDLKTLHQRMFESQELIIQTNIQQREALQVTADNLRSQLQVLEHAAAANKNMTKANELYDVYRQRDRWADQRVIDYASVHRKGTAAEKQVLGAPPLPWMQTLILDVSKFALLYVLFKRWMSFIGKGDEIVLLVSRVRANKNVNSRDMQAWSQVLTAVSRGPTTAQTKMSSYEPLNDAEIRAAADGINERIGEQARVIAHNLIQCRSILPYVTMTSEDVAAIDAVPDASRDSQVDASAHELASKVFLAGSDGLKVYEMARSDELVSQWNTGEVIDVAKLSEEDSAEVKELKDAVRTSLKARLQMIADARWAVIRGWNNNTGLPPNRQKAFNIIARRWRDDRAAPACTDLLSNQGSCGCVLWTDPASL